MVLMVGLLSIGAPSLIPSGVAGAVMPAVIGQPGSFDPDIPEVFVGQGRPTSSLYMGQQADGALVLNNLGSKPKISYNSIGFNTVDGFIYGIKADPDLEKYGTDVLVKINSSGQIVDSGAVAGLPSPSFNGNATKGNSYTQGAFGGTAATAQTLYVRDYFHTPNNTKMWAIDVTTKTATVMNLSAPITDLSDFTWKDDGLWGASGTHMYKIVPGAGSTATVTSIPLNLPEIMGKHLGAAWTYGNGNLGFLDNTTGEIFQVAVNSTGTPAAISFTIVTRFPWQSSNNNDGTNIKGLPVDLGVVKTGPANYRLGEPISYTMTVTNHGAGVSSGSVLTDILPPELINPVTTTPGCAIDSSVLKCVLGALAVNATKVVQVTASVAAAIPDPNRAILNRVDVLGNEEDPNLSNNWSETTAVPIPGKLELLKSSDPVPGTTVRPGDVINYTLKFTNTGGLPMPVNHVDALTDVLDDADIEGPIVALAPLSATLTPAGISISGNLVPDATATVKYSMRVKTTLPISASGKLGNFLVASGTAPPTECIVSSNACTEHPVRVSLSWNKVNDGSPAVFLAGSEWTLTPFDRSPTPILLPANKIDVVDCVAANAANCSGHDKNPAAGKFTIDNLTIGKYRLTETKAPAGYLRIDPIDIEVFGNVQHGNIINMQTAVPALPLTGGMGKTVFWGVTGGLGLFAAIALLLQRRQMRTSVSARSSE